MAISQLETPAARDSLVQWSSNSPLVTVSRGGLATAATPAQATNVTISATYQGKMNSMQLLLTER